MVSHKEIGLVSEIIIMAIVIFVILLFLGIGILVLIHVCIAGRSSTTEFDNNSQIEAGNRGNPSMSLNDLEKLPCYDYMAKSKGSSPVDCAVCLDNFKVGDKCRLLPKCKHSFHAQCVDLWLLKTPICPICRASAHSRWPTQVIGEESSIFSDTNIDMNGTHTTRSNHFRDANIELRDRQATASSDITSENRQTQEESIRLNITVIESSEQNY